MTDANPDSGRASTPGGPIGGGGDVGPEKFLWVQGKSGWKWQVLNPAWMDWYRRVCWPKRAVGWW
jgi:hypothetical protein